MRQLSLFVDALLAPVSGALAQQTSYPPILYPGTNQSPTATDANSYFFDIGQYIGPPPGSNQTVESACCGILNVTQFASAITGQASSTAVATVQQQFADYAKVLASVQNRYDRLAQGIALSSALTILPPNPGDRFSVTFGGAGFDSQGAGAISATARLNASTVAYLGYARSVNENVVKGGVSFSFH